MVVCQEVTVSRWCSWGYRSQLLRNCMKFYLKKLIASNALPSPYFLDVLLSVYDPLGAVYTHSGGTVSLCTPIIAEVQASKAILPAE